MSDGQSDNSSNIIVNNSKKRTSLCFVLIVLALCSIAVVSLWASIANKSGSEIIASKLYENFDDSQSPLWRNEETFGDLDSSSSYIDTDYEYPDEQFEIFANVLDNIRSSQVQYDEDFEEDFDDLSLVRVIVRKPDLTDRPQQRLPVPVQIQHFEESEEEEEDFEIPGWMKANYENVPTKTVTRQRPRRPQVYQRPQTTTPPLTFLQPLATEIAEKQDNLVQEDQLPFLLGVLPATLATLLVLGHLPPIQILLVGALIVSGFLLATRGQEGAIEKNDKDIARFVEAVTWLDSSVLAPLLTENNVRLLYELSAVLDKLALARKELQVEEE